MFRINSTVLIFVFLFFPSAFCSYILNWDSKAVSFPSPFPTSLIAFCWKSVGFPPFASSVKLTLFWHQSCWLP